MTILETIRAKILVQSELSAQVLLWRQCYKKIVFTNGCFDILHRGHVEYLAQAAAMGDMLVVGLNSDASVQRLKGAERPLLDQSSRALALAAMRFVGCVVIFEDDTPYELIKTLLPDVLVKGGDYTPTQIAGSDIVAARGGTIAIIPMTIGYSTTSVVRKMKNIV